MHSSFAMIRTPPHLAPWVPPLRQHHFGVRFELGQIHPEPVPPPVYRPLPAGRLGDGLLHSLERRACPDCAESYQPRAWNQARCPACGRAYRLRQAAARKTTSRTRRPSPRPLSAAWLKGQATRKINQATRARAEAEQRNGRPRSAA